MPDANGNFLGDRATILSDNTPALIHFSNQFAQMEQQRRAQKLALAKQDEERRIRVQKYIGDRLNDKDFETNATYGGLVNSRLTGISEKWNKALRSGMPEDQVMNGIDQDTIALKTDASKINQQDKNIAQGAAELMKIHPNMDASAFISLTKHDNMYKTDQDGNPVLMEPSEIKPDVDILKSYKDHYANLFPAGEGSKEMLDMFDKSKHEDIAESTAFGKDNVTVNRIGYSGKLPGFVSVVKDDKGHTVTDKSGNPIVEITGSKNYRLPGEQADYTDETGKKVRVVSDKVFSDNYHGAIGANIEAKVLEQIHKAGLSPDSEYANMLRKNMLYQQLQSEAANRYKFKLDDAGKEAFDRQMKLRSANRQDQALAISRKHLSIAEQALKDKEDKAEGGKDYIPPDFLSAINDKYGEDVEVEDKPMIKGETHWIGANDPDIPATHKTIRIIPATADPKDLDIVAGKMNATSGERPVEPKRYKTKDGKTIYGYAYDAQSGNATGKADNKIDKDAVQRIFVNSIKKGTGKELYGKQPKPANNPLGLDLK